MLLEGLDGIEGLTSREQLLEIARLDVAIARKDEDLARVVINQMPALFGAHRISADAAIAPGIDAISRVISAGVAAGEFVAEFDPATLSRLLLASLSAFEQEALSDTRTIGLDDVVDLVDRHFVVGLLP